MEESITQFIHSEAGMFVGIALIAVGLIDTIFGYRILRDKPHLLPLPPEQLKKATTLLFFMSMLLVVSGIYILALRISA